MMSELGSHAYADEVKRTNRMVDMIHSKTEEGDLKRILAEFPKGNISGSYSDSGLWPRDTGSRRWCCRELGSRINACLLAGSWMRSRWPSRIFNSCTHIQDRSLIVVTTLLQGFSQRGVVSGRISISQEWRTGQQNGRHDPQQDWGGRGSEKNSGGIPRR